MAKMGSYCKAYPVKRLREFSGWIENKGNARKEKLEVDGKATEVTRELTDETFLYVQEDFTVTDGVFIDENIIFADATPEWIEFCKSVLKFEVPSYLSAKAEGA